MCGLAFQFHKCCQVGSSISNWCRSDLQFQTCGDMNPNTKEGAKSVVDFFPCADYGLQRNLSARTETHPNKDKCCMVPVTCASSGLTCPDKYTPIQANSNNVFTNFNSECCMVGVVSSIVSAGQLLSRETIWINRPGLRCSCGVGNLHGIVTLQRVQCIRGCHCI